MDKLLVTGGAGFIGSHFVKRMLRADDIGHVTVLDALTYAGHIENLGEAFLSPKLTFVHGNILDADLVDTLVRQHTAIVHFAAESHVDRSFDDAGPFLLTNLLGTQTLADAAMRHGIDKFVHVSTDEVYGPLPQGSATEADPLRPTVPYAASKAASDLVALSYHHTYGVPVCVTRSSNNYGPYQHPEKIIPLFATRLLRGQQVTLHDRGQHLRNWLHVEDNCAGVELVLRGGTPGEVYNIGGGTDFTSKELTSHLLRLCGADWDSVVYVPDRRSNDVRYSVTWDKLADLGYRPVRDFEEGLAETVDWYRRNPDRWAPLMRNPHAAHTTVALTPAKEEAHAH
ncbi:MULTISPECIES: dTDP-glucose 4,6-dehydratase [Streptomyces]|uniref:dTDP-glucose 4,6-dehydratase n=1 Tax=Streptomyces bottropensis ATCC 25435 TaxID=1054862 RepID=M3EJ39_9ACTN|nr:MULTISPECIES: dTDP-glucose 4,6-dehydratase [Streptomyces]EMF56361.1 putative NAD-dependent epimerase/dehydratase [Streptomyces bottropensis ATCC 25435]MZD16841.1 dTDP-glucose 4,6-dehydratase [Streptomyces sp. SID5476]